MRFRKNFFGPITVSAGGQTGTSHVVASPQSAHVDFAVRSGIDFDVAPVLVFPAKKRVGFLDRGSLAIGKDNACAVDTCCVAE